MTVVNPPPTAPRRSCVNSRYGCIGRVVPKVVKYRGADWTLREITALVCNRCGQAHGRAT